MGMGARPIPNPYPIPRNNGYQSMIPNNRKTNDLFNKKCDMYGTNSSKTEIDEIKKYKMLK